MNINYLETFRTRYYEQDRKEFLDATSEYLQSHMGTVIPGFIGDLEHLFAELARLQEELPVAVGWIQLSLLESSVYLEKPVLQAEVFDQNGLYGKLVYATQFKISWLFGAWETFKKNLTGHVQEMHAERFIHPEQIRVLMFETLEYLIFMVTVYLKYVVAYSDRMEGFGKLICADQFTISMGQYHDWQRILYRQDREVDPFFNPDKKSLVFQKYQDHVYRDKTFKDLDLSHVRFINCKFIRCKFEASAFHDAVFEQCLLHQVEIVDTTMYGVSFTGCQFEQVDFAGAKLCCTDHTANEFYQQAEFINCESTQPLPNPEVG